MLSITKSRLSAHLVSDESERAAKAGLAENLSLKFPFLFACHTNIFFEAASKEEIISTTKIDLIK